MSYHSPWGNTCALSDPGNVVEMLDRYRAAHLLSQHPQSEPRNDVLSAQRKQRTILEFARFVRLYPPT